MLTTLYALLFDRSLPAQGRWIVLIPVTWKEQSLHWIAADGYQDQEGAPLRMLGVVMDISKRRQAEEQIAQLNTDLHVHAVEFAEANKALDGRVKWEIRNLSFVTNGFHVSDSPSECRGPRNE